MSLRYPWVILVVACLLPFLFTACGEGSPTPTGSQPPVITTETPSGITPEPSLTPVPPTSTPIPLAALVNGEPITLAEFQAELARFQASSAASGTNLASDPNTIVLNDLIEQTLLAQAAVENGFIVDETLLQSRIGALEAQLGGTQALADWTIAHGYTPDDFKQALRRSIAAAWMRDQIAAAVPTTAEQVHVLQILLYNSTQADQVYALLQSGQNFPELAASYNPTTGGDLGWFPQGYLSEPSLEEAAFALQPGQYSPVIETDLGFHILYVIERDAQHPLDPDARRALQLQALQDWLTERRNQSNIQILLP
jgi:peptidyl-prolyl cis-trans isomerase C